MKTEIAKFCKEYDSVLSPLVGELKKSSACIETEAGADVLRATLAGLIDVGMRLKSLADKIEGQQAYLLIFGPLKSGKSTLMNAISGSYVSEVTSLPAYPSLVYVSHGEKAFAMTSYDGKEKAYPDNQSLQEAVTLAHVSLADRIREKEQEGGEFDPGVDFPEAIRRIDIQLPISDLVESSTVMVDTPGLYSRMKFGYDLMTREFRDSAACAVFVVKTDNLYLEQVFAEFKDLLDLFSRIFLVVNIDGGKRDLQPDGTLQPSLESQNPGKIIEAFESLAMNAQLKDALDDGRLRIYPIDLLKSAADHLQKTSGENPEAAEAWPVVEDAESESQGGTFDAFRQDLTGYLNSNEYFLGFTRDSLRQGRTLCQETKKHCGPDSLADFYKRRDTLAEQIADAEGKNQAALDIGRVDNQNIFQIARRDCEQKAWQLANGLNEEVASEVEKAVSKWNESDDSLGTLLHTCCNPILQDFVAKVDAKCIGQVQALVNTPSGGAAFPLQTLKAMDSLGISLSEIGRSVLQRLDREQQQNGSVIDLDVETIPVRKTIIDWILFRNQAAIRRRILGTADNLTQPIPREVKHKRLGQEGLQAIRELCIASLNRHFCTIPTKSSDRALGNYATGFLQELEKRLTSAKSAHSEELEQLQARINSDENITESLERLRRKADEIETRISKLTDTYTSDAEKIEDLPIVTPDSAREDADTDKTDDKVTLSPSLFGHIAS
jgi:GTPase SAR1 family protein